MEERLEQMEKKLDRIAEAIIGDPADETKPGLVIRLDRLERSYSSMKKAVAVLGGSLVSVIVTVATAIILKAI